MCDELELSLLEVFVLLAGLDSRLSCSEFLLGELNSCTVVNAYSLYTI